MQKDAYYISRGCLLHFKRMLFEKYECPFIFMLNSRYNTVATIRLFPP